jgi:histone-lysine N-methyltransferase SETD1
VKFSRSATHAWGLYADEPIANDEFVIEYIGERLRSVLGDKREASYEARSGQESEGWCQSMKPCG